MGLKKHLLKEKSIFQVYYSLTLSNSLTWSSKAGSYMKTLDRRRFLKGKKQVEDLIQIIALKKPRLDNHNLRLFSYEMFHKHTHYKHKSAVNSHFITWP